MRTRFGIGMLLAGLLAMAALLPGMSAATVIYPPHLGPAVRTAEGFELTGTVYNYGGTTTYHFEYGTTVAYGTSAPTPDADAGSAIASQVSAQVTGLAANTTYHYRLTSTNSVEGTASTTDGTFSTTPPSTAPPGGGTTGPTAPSGPAPGTGAPSTPGAGAGAGAGAGNGAGAGAGSSPSSPTPVVTGKGPTRVAKELHTRTQTLLTTLGGRTLYTLSAEKRGKFVCTESSGCTSIWLPLIVASGVVPQGPTKLGTIARPDGSLQVTLHGLPLYTFSGDKKPGQTKGDGLKDVGVWHPAVVSKRAASESGPGSY
jgi:predicted lipoprotein with Yx(FWY)xxD motif